MSSTDGTVRAASEFIKDNDDDEKEKEMESFAAFLQEGLRD